MRISEPGGASSKPAASPSPAQKVRSTVIDWTKSATRGGHQTTAGEVAGRGEFPGVPGYSTLDNWARSKETGTYTAPDYVSELLQQAGYAPPVPAGTGRQSINGLNFDAADDLVPYGYSVTEDEARNILETYAPAAKGNPEKLTKQRVESRDRAVPMTPAAYDKLSSDQRAAVDFNTALIAAREKDLNSGWMIQVPADERAAQGAGMLRDPKFESESSKRMKEMFGEDALTGGNPEHTMKLLERIGYKAPGSSLTDFMSLDMAISADELKDLELPSNAEFFTTSPNVEKAKQGPKNPFTGEKEPSPFDQVEANDYSKVRSAENLGMLQLDVIRKASNFLASNRTVDRNPASSALVSFGAPLGDGDVPQAWSLTGKDVDPIHSKVFEILLNDPTKTKVASSKDFWAKIKGVGYKEKDIDKLFAYIDERTRWMEANGMKPKAGQNAASVIREMAGLGPSDG